MLKVEGINTKITIFFQCIRHIRPSTAEPHNISLQKAISPSDHCQFENDFPVFLITLSLTLLRQAVFFLSTLFVSFLRFIKKSSTA